MTTIVGSRRDADGNTTAFYDTTTQETLLRLLPASMDEDFIGAGHSAFPTAGAPATGYPWVKRTQQTGGAPSVGIIANSVAGIVALALDATSEKQEASLYGNDQFNWDMSKGAVWETRVAFGVLPTGVVEIVFGLQSAWIDGPDNAGFYARFQASASGAVNMQSKDGISTLSKATGITLVAGAYRNFRIDASDPTNVIYAIDGATVSAPGAMTFAATGASAVLQPYFSVYKASGAGLGTMDVDMIQVSCNRQ